MLPTTLFYTLLTLAPLALAGDAPVNYEHVKVTVTISSTTTVYRDCCSTSSLLSSSESSRVTPYTTDSSSTPPSAQVLTTSSTQPPEVSYTSSGAIQESTHTTSCTKSSVVITSSTSSQTTASSTLTSSSAVSSSVSKHSKSKHSHSSKPSKFSSSSVIFSSGSSSQSLSSSGFIPGTSSSASSSVSSQRPSSTGTSSSTTTSGPSTGSPITSSVTSSSTDTAITTSSTSSSTDSATTTSTSISYSYVDGWNDNTFDTPAPTISPTLLLPATAVPANVQASPTHGFAYGHGNSDGSVFGCNVEIEGEGMPIVNGDTFMPFINAVECTSGGMHISFKDALSYAMAATWPQQFVFVTPPQGSCSGSGNGRTYYSISSWTTDPLLFAFTLAGSKASMSDVLRSIKVDYDTVAPANGTTKHRRDEASTTISLDTNSFKRFISSNIASQISAFTNGYNSVMNMDIEQMKELDGSKLQADSRVQCPTCGVTTSLTMYGNANCYWKTVIDTVFGSLRVPVCDSAKAGIRMNGMKARVAFDIFGIKDYSGGHAGLESLPLPAITIEDIITIQPSAELRYDLDFKLKGGGMNVVGLGVEWQQQHSASVEVDIVAQKASSQGWTDIQPTMAPYQMIGNVPSEFDFHGEFGPVLGASISLIDIIKVGMDVGLNTPYVDMSIRSSNQSPDPCSKIDNTYQIATPSGTRKRLDFHMGAGVAVWTQVSGAIGPLKKDTGHISVYQSPSWTIIDKCWAMGVEMIDTLSGYYPGYLEVF